MPGESSFACDPLHDGWHYFEFTHSDDGYGIAKSFAKSYFEVDLAKTCNAGDVIKIAFDTKANVGWWKHDSDDDGNHRVTHWNGDGKQVDGKWWR